MEHPYKKSKHRSQYVFIAFVTFSSPEHVYNLAHSDDIYFFGKDRRIILLLKSFGIVKAHRYDD